jgi:hypothetical protein
MIIYSHREGYERIDEEHGYGDDFLFLNVDHSDLHDVWYVYVGTILVVDMNESLQSTS